MIYLNDKKLYRFINKNTSLNNTKQPEIQDFVRKSCTFIV